MKMPDEFDPDDASRDGLLCDLLILSDGTVLAHNLTPVMAAALQILNPGDETLRQRSMGRAEPPASSSAAMDPIRLP